MVLIAVSIGGMLGRISAVNSVDLISQAKVLKKQGRQIERPFLSGNDRSRWATVRALVEHGTYAIDDIVIQPNWDTIDMVKHDDQGRPAPRVGDGHLYSSKPPLLATLWAGEYWAIHKLTGKTLGEHPFAIGRFMLISLNVMPLLIYFWLLAEMAERFGKTDFGRIFMVACGCFGTFLSTFVIVLTNHLPAAVSAGIALLAALKIIYDGDRRLVRLLRVRPASLCGLHRRQRATGPVVFLPALGLAILEGSAAKRSRPTCRRQPLCLVAAPGDELPGPRFAHSALCPPRAGL